MALKKNNDDLLKKITSQAKKLDEDEKKNILRQIEIMLHNKEVLSEFEENKKRRVIAQKEIPDDKSDNTDVKIIESEDGKRFRFFIGNFPKMFMLDEMKKMVKICHTSENRDDGAKRLSVWFKNNRQDFFLDIQTSDKNKIFMNMYDKITQSYTVKS